MKRSDEKTSTGGNWNGLSAEADVRGSADARGSKDISLTSPDHPSRLQRESSSVSAYRYQAVRPDRPSSRSPGNPPCDLANLPANRSLVALKNVAEALP